MASVKYASTMLVAGAFATWFGITVLSQHPDRRFDRLRDYDPLGGLIPDWRFFAPEPVQYDYSIVHRTLDVAGGETAWRPSSAISERSWKDFIWFPERREEKAICELCIELLAHASLNGESWTRGPSYRLLRDCVLREVRREHMHGAPPVLGVQFAVLRRRGHDVAAEPERVLVSPFIPALPGAA